MNALNRWTDDLAGGLPGSRYDGEWLSLKVFTIPERKRPNVSELWFFSCASLWLDCIALKATTLAAAKDEALTIAVRMCTRYRRELAEARLVLNDAAATPASPSDPEFTGMMGSPSNHMPKRSRRKAAA